MGDKSPYLSTSRAKVIENRTICNLDLVSAIVNTKTLLSMVSSRKLIQFCSLRVDFLYHVLVMIVSPCNS